MKNLFFCILLICSFQTVAFCSEYEITNEDTLGALFFDTSLRIAPYPGYVEFGNPEDIMLCSEITNLERNSFYTICRETNIVMYYNGKKIGSIPLDR